VYLCLLLTLLSGVAGAELGPNLLPNGDFERGPWRAERDERLAAVDMLRSHSGLQSGRLRALPDREAYVYGPGLDLDPARTYVLLAWIRCQGVTDPQGVHLRFLQWSDKEPVGWIWNWDIGQGVQQLVRTGGTHEWRRLAVRLRNLDPRTVRATPFFAVAPGEGTAWLDDVEVRELDGAELPPELASPLDEPGTFADLGPEPPPVPGLPHDFQVESLGLPPRAAARANLLENGSLEALPPADWKAAVSLDRAVKHGGDASLFLAPTSDSFVVTTPEIDADLDYRLSVWLRTENVPDGGLRLRLWPGWWNEATMSEDLIVTGGTQDWTRQEIILTDLPPALSGKRWFLHYALSAPEGAPAPRAWLDDVEIVPLADSLRVTSAPLGNIFLEDEAASLTCSLRSVPANASRRLRYAVTGFWGQLVTQGEVPLLPDAGSNAEAKLPLPGRGYAGFHLVLQDGAGKPLQHRFVSAALLPPMPRDARALRPESVFACWGVPAELAPRLGVKWTRWVERSIYFTPINGRRDDFAWTLEQWNGKYDPRADRLAEQQAGLSTYLCFHRFADWLLQGADGQRSAVPRDWDRFADWVRFVYGQVADVVKVVEVWNEPVIPWGWDGTPEDIVTLHRVVYQTVKAISPEAVILGPCDSTEHLDTFGKLGGFQWVDAVAVHPYRPDSPEATDFAGELSRVREIVAKYGPPKDLWITEMGWTTAPGRFTELEQANWVARAYLLALSGRVRNLNVHIFGDWNNPSASEKYYGLTRTDRSPKPAAVACATLTRNLEGARFVRALEGLPRATYGLEFEREGEPVAVLWNAARDGVEVRMPLAAAEATLQRLDGTFDVRPVTGGELRVTVGQSPVFIRAGGAR
jgi:hypothetical protein